MEQLIPEGITGWFIQVVVLAVWVTRLLNSLSMVLGAPVVISTSFVLIKELSMIGEAGAPVRVVNPLRPSPSSFVLVAAHLRHLPVPLMRTLSQVVVAGHQ